MKRIGLPGKAVVPPEAVQRLMHKFAERKALEEQEKFWRRVQDSKQPQQSPINWDQLGVLE